MSSHRTGLTRSLEQSLGPLPATAELLAENAALRNRIVELEARVGPASREGAPGGDVRRSSAILHKAADGFVLLDMDGRILDANDAFCRMSGYARDELLAMSVPDLDAAGRLEEVRRRIRDLAHTGSGRFEARHRRKDGESIDLDVSVAFVPVNGGRLSCLLHDVTARTRAERVMERRRHQRCWNAVVSPSQAADGRGLRPRRILLIDDDPTVRRTMADLLQEVGHSVAVAEGGAEGLAHLGQNRVDLVITDLGMPGMTGWEVARAVKLVTSHPPVVLLTGWGEHPASRSEHAGLVDRILGKPIRLDELLAAIRDLTRSADDPGDALS